MVRWGVFALPAEAAACSVLCAAFFPPVLLQAATTSASPAASAAILRLLPRFIFLPSFLPLGHGDRKTLRLTALLKLSDLHRPVFGTRNFTRFGHDERR